MRQVVGKKSDDQIPGLLTQEGFGAPDYKETQSFQTLLLADSGIDEAGQRPIAVERVVVLYFRTF